MRLPRRIQNSLRLFTASMTVLRRNPRLPLFPLISFTITAIIATVVFVLPGAWLIGHLTGHSPTEAAAWSALGGHVDQWMKRPHAPLTGSLRLMSAILMVAV